MPSNHSSQKMQSLKMKPHSQRRFKGSLMKQIINHSLQKADSKILRIVLVDTFQRTLKMCQSHFARTKKRIMSLGGTVMRGIKVIFGYQRRSWAGIKRHKHIRIACKLMTTVTTTSTHSRRNTESRLTVWGTA